MTFHPMFGIDISYPLKFEKNGQEAKYHPAQKQGERDQRKNHRYGSQNRENCDQCV